MNKKTFKAEISNCILLKGGRLVDPQTGLNEKADLLIENGTIVKIGKVDEKGVEGRVVDCKGKIIAPGFIDMHVHLREPGEEHKETIESGCNAAMNGGFTGVAPMPNTSPVIDHYNHVTFINKRSEGLLVDVYPIGAITKGQKGEELAEMGEMKEAGAVGFSDDGHPVASGQVMRHAIEYGNMLDVAIINHCEDMSITGEGVMNESFSSTETGFRGISSVSESAMVARDILLAEFSRCPVHIAHVSTKEAVRLIRDAKSRDVKVTAETCPHYLTMTDKAVKTFNTNTKMKPPLRTEEDRLALVEAVADGTIDAIVTDHAPHHADDKDNDYHSAAFGVIGLETAVGVILDRLVHGGHLKLEAMIQCFAVAPRKIFRLPEVKITEGETANITILDMDKKWTVKGADFASLSFNTPFEGWELKGAPAGVVNKGMLYLND
ncbi:dihydroorotase [bacterium]|nr:dihydroorotase [bacterium]